VGERQFIVPQKDRGRRSSTVDPLKLLLHHVAGLPERLRRRKPGVMGPEERLMQRSRHDLGRFHSPMAIVDTAEEPKGGADLQDMPIFHAPPKADIRDLMDPSNARDSRIGLA
jgi:hypothetical protein